MGAAGESSLGRRGRAAQPPRPYLTAPSNVPRQRPAPTASRSPPHPRAWASAPRPPAPPHGPAAPGAAAQPATHSPILLTAQRSGRQNAPCCPSGPALSSPGPPSSQSQRPGATAPKRYWRRAPPGDEVIRGFPLRQGCMSRRMGVGRSERSGWRNAPPRGR